MIRPRRPWSGLLCVVALIGPLAGCGGAKASPSDVIADFNADGAIDGQTDKDPQIDVTHTVSDLVRAQSLMELQQPAQLAAFMVTDQAAIKQALLGIGAAKATPTGQPGVPAVDLPTWAVVTAGGAGLLVLGGIGSAVYRRTRRRIA
jgi:hypothetical protein